MYIDYNHIHAKTNMEVMSLCFHQQLPVPQLIDQATSYMIQLKERVEHLKKKKTILLGGAVENRSQGSSHLPKLSIYSRDSTIQMNLVVDLNMKRVMLHELVTVFEEQGAQVMSAHLHNLNDRTTYTIIAQVCMNTIHTSVSLYTRTWRLLFFPNSACITSFFNMVLN